MYNSLYGNSSFSMILDKTFNAFKNNLLTYILSVLLLNAVMLAFSALVGVVGYKMIMPFLSNSTSNSLFTGLYTMIAIILLIGIVFMFFTIFYHATNYYITKTSINKYSSSVSAILRSSVKKFKYLFTLYLAKAIFFIPILASMFLILYRLFGISGIISALSPNQGFAGNKVLFLIVSGLYGLLLIFFDVLFTHANVVAMRKKFYFFKPMFYSSVMIVEEKKLLKTFLMRVLWTFLGIAYFIVIYLLVGFFVKPLPIFSGNFLYEGLFPFYKLLFVYLISIVPSPLLAIFRNVLFFSESSENRLKSDRYYKAGLGSRACAFIIDFSIVFIIVFVFINLVSIIFGAGSMSFARLASLNLSAKFSFIFLLILFMTAYNVLLELKHNGATIGKSLLDMRVVSMNNETVTLTQSVVRNILKYTVDMFFVAAFLIFFRTDKSRLGDIYSETKVVAKAKS